MESTSAFKLDSSCFLDNFFQSKDVLLNLTILPPIGPAHEKKERISFFVETYFVLKRRASK